MDHPLFEAMRRGVVLGDGGVGTLLLARGWSGNTAVAALERPELVRTLHEDYIAAGADLILTDSFAGNRSQLGARYADRVRDINFAAARLARDAREIAGASVFVGGSVGPIGRDLAVGAWTLSQAHDAFVEQIEALVEGGVDLIVLETFPNVAEAVEALRATRAVTDLPVAAMLNFSAELVSSAGEQPRDFARALSEAGADLVGVNCGVGPQGALDIVEQIAIDAERAPIAVQPNAGLPRVVQRELVYPSSPGYFADFALRAKDLGATLIAGCCGTTPEHVRAMREALGSGRERPAGTVRSAPQAEPPPLVEPAATLEPSLLRDKLAAGKFVVSVEVDPPRGTNPRKAIEGAAMLREAGADAINIGDSPMARVRMSALALAVRMQREAAIETIIHQTTRDRNLMALQADMLGAHALGIRNVIALGGDPPPEASQSSAVWDVDSIGFIRVLKGLNEGVDFAGNSIGRATDFFVACAANPTADDLALELRRVREKLDAGADMLMTQPVYDTQALRSFFERLGAVAVPVLLGVMPLVSYRNAEFVHNELPGVVVPQAVRARMRAAGEAGTDAGIDIAVGHVEETRALPYVSGIYIMPAFGRYEIAAEVVRRIERDDG